MHTRPTRFVGARNVGRLHPTARHLDFAAQWTSDISAIRANLAGFPPSYRGYAARKMEWVSRQLADPTLPSTGVPMKSRLLFGRRQVISTKRFQPDAIVAKLRHAAVLLGQGNKVAAVV